MLDDADLGGRVGFTQETMKVALKRHTFPKAPFPTHLRSMKWKRLTSASKSMTYERTIWGRNVRKEGREANLGTTAEGAHGDRLKIGYRLIGPEGERERREKRKSEKGEEN